MKMLINRVFAIAAFMLASSVASATVWHPVNIDSDFIQFDPVETYGGTLSLFDDDTGFAGPALEIGQNGGHITFVDNQDGSWDAVLTFADTSPGGSITLSGNKNFTLGISWDGGTTYFGDFAYELTSTPDTYLIGFLGQEVTGGPLLGYTLAVDVAPVPVPAAVWLFGTGLLGLVGVARRRA